MEYGVCKCCSRFVEFSLSLQDHAEIVIRSGIARFDFNRLSITPGRRVELALVLPCRAQVVVRIGIIGLRGNCCFVTGDSFSQAIVGLQYQAQAAMCLGKIWFDP